MKRKLMLLGLLALCMCFAAGCGGSSGGAGSAASNEGSGQGYVDGDWYDEMLADESVRAEYPYCRLLDINEDGIEEVFLSSTQHSFIGAEDKAKLVAEVDGAPKDLKKIGGAAGESFSFHAPDNTLFYYSRVSGEEHLIKYELADGKLQELSTADEYDKNHDPEGGNTDETYYLDGKKVTEDEFDVLWDQYDDGSEAITYSKTGDANPAADDDTVEPDDDPDDHAGGDDGDVDDDDDDDSDDADDRDDD